MWQVWCIFGEQLAHSAAESAGVRSSYFMFLDTKGSGLSPALASYFFSPAFMLLL